MAFGKVSDHVSSGYFKPAEHINDIALLIETKKIDKDVPNEYRGQVRPRDEALADIAVFANQADVDAQKPSQLLKSVKVVHSMLTSTLENFVESGEAIVVHLDKVSTQNGSGFVFRDVTDAGVLSAAEAYYNARTEAAAAAPGFDD